MPTLPLLTTTPPRPHALDAKTTAQAHLDVHQALAAHASLLHTRCGNDRMVWRRWAPAAPRATPPVVLLHGGSGSWTHWVRNISALLDAGHTVWAPDLPGFGDSAQPPAGADADALIPVLAQGLQQLMPDTPCQLVGFSFGGMVAGLLAAAAPHSVAQLVVVGAPGMGINPTPTFRLKGWRHLPDADARLAVHHHNLAVLMFHDPRHIAGLALAVHAANVVRDRMPRRRLSSTDVLAQALRAVDCPVCVLYGEHDVLYRHSMPELETAWRCATPDLRHYALLPNAGHWVMFEAAAAFNTRLLGWLADPALRRQAV
jgi:2-hydroxy-6-oxonona-2,4-dienedioate hydrolase